MRRVVITVLCLVQVAVTAAIFACGLQLSQALVHSATAGRVATAMLRTTRRLASVQLHITLGA